MKSKRILALVLSATIVAAGFTACTAAQTDGNQEVETATQVVTEVVTNGQGEAITEVVTEVVTNEQGEEVTEAVTDENGKAVTEVVTEVVTDKNGDTVTEVVTKPSTTATTKKQTTTANNSTTKKPQGTTTNNSPTKKPQSTTSKVTTTEPEIIDTAIPIVLQKNMQASCKSPNVSIAQGEVIIDKPGDYVFTQTTADWHGQIIVKLKNTEKASIRFENVHISNTTKNIIQILDSSINSNRSFLEAEAAAEQTELDNALQDVADNDKAPNVSISFPEGTSSSFSTSANAYTGVLYNESKLTIKGHGSATFESKQNANNCICSTKSITIKNVGLNLKTAQNTNPSSLAKTSGSAKGIFSYSKVYMESGFLTIKSNGDAIRCDTFTMNGGTSNIKSSACDGIDTDDAIVINGGSITSVALEKYSFKVRRVNNTENASTKGKVRSGRGDCFRINGGTVQGESKKITSLDRQFQSDKKGSSQANLTAKIIKQNAGNAELAASESKVPAIIKIGNWSSRNKCTKFLYSSSSVTKGKTYKASANGNTANITWSGAFGVATVKNNTNQ